MKIKYLLAAATVAALPSLASAVTIGQLDVVGSVNPSNSQYTATGEVDFVGFGTAEIASGIFASIITNAEALGNPSEPTIFDLFDIEFEAPGPQLIFSGGGFSFFATSFLNFDNVFPGRAFDADGFVTTASGNLPGRFSLSTQALSSGETQVSFSSTTTVIPLPASALLLISAMAGLGFLSYRRRSAVA